MCERVIYYLSVFFSTTFDKIITLYYIARSIIDARTNNEIRNIIQRAMNAKYNIIPPFLTSPIIRVGSREDSISFVERREHAARARETATPTCAPSVNERERKAFEGRRPAGRAGVARVSGESVRVSLCHLRVGTRQRCYRNLSDVCLPVRRRRVTAVSFEVCFLRVPVLFLRGFLAIKSIGMADTEAK